MASEKESIMFINTTVCRKFKLTMKYDYFWVDFEHFWIEQYFWRQLGKHWKWARAMLGALTNKFSALNANR